MFNTVAFVDLCVCIRPQINKNASITRYSLIILETVVLSRSYDLAICFYNSIHNCHLLRLEYNISMSFGTKIQSYFSKYSVRVCYLA